ncbi:Clp protease N-terminal domain-containing protein [Microlunatus ginsengisoli]|uniref:Clp amino terminal domain-containing protein, pathogenicity island component n=1 Tax=Microlunatus ginsengisoli TaxID=363863 RepID=A0ABP7A7H5_9ACTN
MASKRTALIVAGGVLVLGAGVGAATLASADPTPSAGPTAGPSAQPAGPDGRGGPGAGPGGHGPRGRLAPERLAKQLAAKLGVDETKVAEAITAFREASRPTRPAQPDSSTQPTPGSPPSPGSRPARPDPSARDEALAKAIAAKLGIDQAKVKSALDEIRSADEAAAKADGKARLTERLDAAVKAGTLTRAEADAVLKAYDKGVIGPR